MKKKQRNSAGKVQRNPNGGRFSVPPNPPSFTAVPWYSLVLRVTGFNSNVTNGDLYSALQSQLGIVTPTFVARIKSVRFWAPIVSSLTPVSVTVFDLVAPSFSTILSVQTRVLDVLMDYPDVVNRASLGYKYPPAQRAVSVRLEAINLFTMFNTVGFGAQSVMYVNLEWRANFINSPPALFSNAEDAEDDVVDKSYRSELYVRDDGTIDTLANKFRALELLS